MLVLRGPPRSMVKWTDSEETVPLLLKYQLCSPFLPMTLMGRCQGQGSKILVLVCATQIHGKLSPRRFRLVSRTNFAVCRRVCPILAARDRCDYRTIVSVGATRLWLGRMVLPMTSTLMGRGHGSKVLVLACATYIHGHMNWFRSLVSCSRESTLVFGGIFCSQKIRSEPHLFWPPWSTPIKI